MSNVASVTKFFPTVNEGYTAVTTAALTANPTTIPLSSVSGLTDGSVFVGIINPSDAVKKQVFTGTVNVAGSSITGCVWTRGSSLAGHPIGTTIVDYTTGTAMNMITKGILKEHSQTGNHTNVTATSITTGNLTATNSVSLPNDSVTPAMVGFTKTVDANGWTVYDYGNWKEYTYLISVTGLTGTALAYDVVGTHTINLPVGVTNANQLFLECNLRSNERVFVASIRSTGESQPNVVIQVSNWYYAEVPKTDYTVYLKARLR